jgi:hypothetical protein
MWIKIIYFLILLTIGMPLLEDYLEGLSKYGQYLTSGIPKAAAGLNERHEGLLSKLESYKVAMDASLKELDSLFVASSYFFRNKDQMRRFFSEIGIGEGLGDYLENFLDTHQGDRPYFLTYRLTSAYPSTDFGRRFSSLNSELWDAKGLFDIAYRPNGSFLGIHIGNGRHREFEHMLREIIFKMSGTVESYNSSSSSMAELHRRIEEVELPRIESELTELYKNNCLSWVPKFILPRLIDPLKLEPPAIPQDFDRICQRHFHHIYG